MYSNTGHTTVFISTGNQLTYLIADVVFFTRSQRVLLLYFAKSRKNGMS